MARLSIATLRRLECGLRFDGEQGFFLNGKPVKIKGTCNHQDHARVADGGIGGA
jgi:hypothetical protein